MKLIKDSVLREEKLQTLREWVSVLVTLWLLLPMLLPVLLWVTLHQALSLLGLTLIDKIPYLGRTLIRINTWMKS